MCQEETKAVREGAHQDDERDCLLTTIIPLDVRHSTLRTSKASGACPLHQARCDKINLCGSSKSEGRLSQGCDLSLVRDYRTKGRPPEGLNGD